MNTNHLRTNQISRIKLFGENYSRVAKREITIAVILILIILWGWFGLYKQITVGHGVTGMRDNAVWGYFISNFIYFIGASYGGALVAAILYYFKIPWGRPVIRIAALMAFISGIIGPFFILLCIGRFDRLHYLIIYARVQSPITWDVMVISTYLVGISIFLYLLLIKDMAILANTDIIEKPKWKTKVYKWLSLGYTGEGKQEDIIDHSTQSVAFIIMPKIILAFAVLSWIFGMTLRPGWHSAIFGPNYIISSVATGVALIIILMWFYRKWYNLEEYITDLQFRKMSLILLILIGIFGYFTFSEYITIWYSSAQWEANLMEKLFTFSEFGWPFHLSNFFAIILPIVILFFRKWRTPNVVTSLSILIAVSMWVKRYLNVVPTLETTLLPIQDTRENYVSYSATWVEWALVLAGAATFILFMMMIPKLVNIIPIKERKDEK
jgi:molybdopterin-containing oxidoreductase family membrane subunit